MKLLIALPSLLLIGAAPPVLEVFPEPPQAETPAPAPPRDCRTDHFAKGTMEVKMQRLGDLPPAETFMAVYRIDEDGCPDPLTASAYRTSNR